ncbi:GNAT family N-acetyltransferase [Candidatus Bathyarchaeota archaeon]|nr:MAG: GNAT family N-acetyltransferase [Candidatus Bathyarchaeota archaeon]
MPSDRIVVRELKPGLATDYFDFFDDIYDNDPWLNSKDNPWWGGCYCSFWDDLREEDEINSSKDKRSANRTARLKMIEEAKASGLLAYQEGKVIGWCNVAPRSSYINLRNLKAVEDSSERVGSIMCFVVSAGHRGSGVAPRLLQSACDLIKSWRIPIAEGYPRNPEAATNNPYNIPKLNLGFRGSLNMFLRSGFHVHRNLERFIVVRKAV